MTAVECSVLLGVLAGTPATAQLAADSLLPCAAQGWLIVRETVITDVTPESGAVVVDNFRRDWQLECAPSSEAGAVRADGIHSGLLRRGRKRGCVMPDFLIGPHVLTHADRLLMRDAGISRDCFSGSALIAPMQAASGQ